MKTNKQWYPYPEFGSYYKLERGELFQCPMNADGTRSLDQAWVDFGSGVDSSDLSRLYIIIQELKLKD